MLKRAEIDDPDFNNQLDPKKWPKLKKRFTEIFKTKTRDGWCEVMEGTDICFAPALSLDEAPNHPHNKDRKTFIEIEGVLQPAPAPRFSRTQPKIQGPPPAPGENTEEVLTDFGFGKIEIEALKSAEVI